MTSEDLRTLLIWARSKDDVRLVFSARAALRGDEEAQRTCADQVQLLHLMGVAWR